MRLSKVNEQLREKKRNTSESQYLLFLHRRVPLNMLLLDNTESKSESVWSIQKYIW